MDLISLEVSNRRLQQQNLQLHQTKIFNIEIHKENNLLIYYKSHKNKPQHLKEKRIIKEGLFYKMPKLILYI